MVNEAKNFGIPRDETEAHSEVDGLRLPWTVEPSGRFTYVVDVDGVAVSGSHLRDRMEYLCAAANQHASLIAVRDAAQEVSSRITRNDFHTVLFSLRTALADTE